MTAKTMTPRNPYLSQTVLDGLELAKRRHLEEVAIIDSLITRTEPRPVHVGVTGRQQARTGAVRRTGHTAAGKGATTIIAAPAGKAPTAGATATGAPAKPAAKRAVSEAGKKRIRAALKKRWAKFHAAKQATTAGAQ
jgi:hypothetical protein